MKTISAKNASYVLTVYRRSVEYGHWCYCFNHKHETSSANWNTLERNAAGMQL